MEGKISSQQILAKKYIEENDLEKIVSEMLNSLVHEKSKTPVVFMIKYLAGLLSEEERKAHNLQIPEPYPKGKPIVKFPAFEDSNDTLLKKHLTKQIWSTVKYNRTKHNGSIMNMIRPVEKRNEPDDKIGLLLTDADCIDQFSQLIEPMVSDLHRLIDSTTSQPKKPSYSISNHNSSSINSQSACRINFPYESIVNENIRAIRFEFSRNLQDFPFSAIITREKRESVEQNIKGALTSLSSDEPLFKNGKYTAITEENESDVMEMLRDRGVFSDRLDEFMVNSNLKANWPENRGVFISENKEMIILVNFIDHLRVTYSVNYVESFLDVFNSAFALIKTLENILSFEHHSLYGYINSSPTLLGAGLEIACGLSISNVPESNIFKTLLQKLDYTDYEIDSVNNSLRINARFKLIHYSEYEFLQAFYSGVSTLVMLDSDLKKTEHLSFERREFEEESGCTYQSYHDCFEEFKDLVSSSGSSINSLIMEGHKEWETGGIVFSEEFDLYFYRGLIQKYLQNSQNYDMSKSEHFKVKSEIMTFSEINSTEKITYIKFTLRRNIEKEPFLTSRFANSESIAKIIQEGISDEAFENMKRHDLNAYYQELKKRGEEEIEEDESEFYGTHRIVARHNLQLISDRIVSYNPLLTMENKDRLLVSFDLGDHTATSVIINDLDHMKLECTLRDDDVSAQNCRGFLTVVEKLSGRLKFAIDQQMGYLTPLPKFLGTGLSISSEIRLITYSQNSAKFKEVFDKYNYHANVIEEETGRIQLFSCITIGLTENDSIGRFIAMVNELFDIDVV